MRLPVTERVRVLAGYTPGEQPTESSLVKLNTNENPYPPSPRVVQAVAREAADCLERYPSPMADELREKAAAVHGVDPDQVLAGNGSDELLAICLRACAGEGGVVAYTTPTYSLYRTLAEIVGARIVEIESRSCTELAASRPAVSFVCNPNSPLGFGVATAEIAELASSVDGLVVSDEAYADFGDCSALALVGAVPNVIVVRSFSKSFSLAGVRLGLAFGHRDLIAELAKVKDSYNVSRLAVAAGVAALDDHDGMRANVARVCATRERVTAVLRAAGFDVADSQTNFLWVDCGAEGGRAAFERLRERGVLVRYFDAEGLRSGIRVTVGTDSQMDRFLEVLTRRPGRNDPVG
ncbi:MAG: histidinol-phosphate transaminase [Candidatus Binatia bacterium]